MIEWIMQMQKLENELKVVSGGLVSKITKSVQLWYVCLIWFEGASARWLWPCCGFSPCPLPGFSISTSMATAPQS